MTKNIFITAALLILLSFGCSKGEVEQSSRWKQSDGWALKKAEQGDKYEKFFAIGSWHLPGYTFPNTNIQEEPQQYDNDSTLFVERSAPFNMIFLAARQYRDYMSDKIAILNPFSWVLYNFLDKVPELQDKNDISRDYRRSQYMKEIVESPDFENYLETRVKAIVKQFPHENYIFSHIDELALGGINRWAVPPVMGAKINSTLKEVSSDALMFVDLVGHCKGSSYLFEQNYLRDHDELPDEPPYELIDSAALSCEIPLLGFSQAYNGKPVYKFEDGKYSYVQYEFDELQAIWQENAKLLATGYRESGDIFTINAFRDYFAYPQLAGITVDALKEALGSEIPIWIYFDGNGYAKPEDMSPEEYVEMVKCQIYTSIIHGATGILFWNDWKKTAEVFDLLLPMLEELKEQLPIVKMKTVRSEWDENLHLMIKKSGRKRWIIATNTSKTEHLPLNLPKLKKETLEPMETFIAEI